MLQRHGVSLAISLTMIPSARSEFVMKFTQMGVPPNHPAGMFHQPSIDFQGYLHESPNFPQDAAAKVGVSGLVWWTFLHLEKLLGGLEDVL